MTGQPTERESKTGKRRGRAGRGHVCCSMHVEHAQPPQEPSRRRGAATQPPKACSSKPSATDGDFLSASSVGLGRCMSRQSLAPKRGDDRLPPRQRTVYLRCSPLATYRVAAPVARAFHVNPLSCPSRHRAHRTYTLSPCLCSQNTASIRNPGLFRCATADGRKRGGRASVLDSSAVIAPVLFNSCGWLSSSTAQP